MVVGATAAPPALHFLASSGQNSAQMEFMLVDVGGGAKAESKVEAEDVAGCWSLKLRLREEAVG